MDYKKTTAPGSTITRDVTDFSQGENIYEVAIPIASKAYITRVDAEPDGDAFFPNFPVDEWNLMSDATFKSDQLHSASYTIETYER